MYDTNDTCAPFPAFEYTMKHKYMEWWQIRLLPAIPFRSLSLWTRNEYSWLCMLIRDSLTTFFHIRRSELQRMRFTP